MILILFKIITEAQQVQYKLALFLRLSGDNVKRSWTKSRRYIEVRPDRQAENCT